MEIVTTTIPLNVNIYSAAIILLILIIVFLLIMTLKTRRELLKRKYIEMP
ncbi:MAG: hypothetical protein QXS69_01300 [Candidatus Aenigmatarchaeota archaeon]